MILVQTFWVYKNMQKCKIPVFKILVSGKFLFCLCCRIHLSSKFQIVYTLPLG